MMAKVRSPESRFGGEAGADAASLSVVATTSLSDVGGRDRRVVGGEEALAGRVARRRGWRGAGNGAGRGIVMARRRVEVERAGSAGVALRFFGVAVEPGVGSAPGVLVCGRFSGPRSRSPESVGASAAGEASWMSPPSPDSQSARGRRPVVDAVQAGAVGEHPAGEERGSRGLETPRRPRERRRCAALRRRPRVADPRRTAARRTAPFRRSTSK